MTADQLDLLVIAPFPLSVDRGSPIRARRLLATARDLGLSVAVLAPTGVAGDADVRAARLPLPPPARPGLAWQKPLFDVELALRAAWTAWRRRPRVIEGHVHEGLLIALVARLCCPSAAVVYNAHGTLTEELVTAGHLRDGGLAARAARALERWLVRHADAVLAQSEHRRQDLVDQGAAAAAVLVVPDAPERELFAVQRPAGRSVTCIYTGSLSRYQGVDDILAAAALTPEVRYVVFGGPSGAYPAKARALGVDRTVTFVDPAPLSALPAALAGADIALVPRHYGGNIPGKLPAYQAAGLPTVGTAVAGVVELLDPSTGAVVAPGDVVALAAAIRSLAADPEARARMGREARHRAAARYSPARMSALLGTGYRTAADRRQRRRPVTPTAGAAA